MLNYLQGIPFLLSFLLLCIILRKSINENNNTFSLILIIVLGVLLRVFICGDLFLHEWDERFHALISKNILQSPLSPKLYDTPLIYYDFKDWSTNHIWLSKPILTFWIMGLSLFTFGVNEFGVRFPSIIISIFSIYITFKIGQLLFNNRVGLLAAFFHAIHGLHLELVGGKISSDHVDVLFLFLFQLTIFYGLKYLKNDFKKHLILFSIFFGLAFLTKWIMSFFIIILFIIFHLYQKKKIGLLIKELIFITLIAGLISGPWMLFLLKFYPIEAKYIFKQIFFPISAPIQGHTGTIFYYINKVRIIFGEIIYLPLIWLFIIAFKKHTFKLVILLTWIFVPLFILSICGTKRETYIMISSVPIFLLTGYAVHFLSLQKNKFKFKWVANLLIILLIGLPIRYSLERLKPFQQKWTTPIWKKEMQKLFTSNNTNPKKIVLINEPNYVNAMFYFDCVAYKKKLNKNELQKLSTSYNLFENVDGVYEKVKVD